MATKGAETEVIRDAQRGDARGQCAELREVFLTERIRAADRQRYAVQRDRHIRANALQDTEGTAAAPQKIFGGGFGEVGANAALQERFVMLNAEPETDLR